MGLFDIFKKPENQAPDAIKRSEIYEKQANTFFDIIKGTSDEPMVYDDEVKKEKAPLEDVYKEVNAYMLNKYGIDVEDSILDPTKLYEVDGLKRIASLRKYNISHAGFDAQYFPKDINLLFFDDLFNKIYGDKAETFFKNPKEIVSLITRQFNNNEKYCVKISDDEYLYYYPNTDPTNAENFNVSLVDNKNNVQVVFTHEENGETIDRSAALASFLYNEVEFYDLAQQKKHQPIGDINVNTYASARIPLMDKIRIKNQILLDLYETGKYDKAQLEVIRGALIKDFDIGYILSPCYSADSMKMIMDFVKANKNEVRLLHDIRLFSTKIANQYKYTFTPLEFSYIFSSIIAENKLDFDNPRDKAELKLNYYKDSASANVESFRTFQVGNENYILTKGPEYPSYSDFLLEKINDDGTTTKIYECKNGELLFGSLDDFMDKLETKYKNKSGLDLIENAFSEVIGAITNEDISGHIRLLHAQDGSIIQIEGVRKAMNDDDLFLAMVTGSSSMASAEIDEKDAGVTISIIKDKKQTILFSEDPKVKDQSICNTRAEAVQEILKHGKLFDNEEVRSTPLNPETVEEQMSDDISLDSVLFDHKYRTLAQENIESLIEMVKADEKRLTWVSSDKETILEFVPSKKDDDIKIDDCNIYIIKNGDRKPLYEHGVKETPEGKIETMNGSIDDVIETVLSNKFDLTNHQRHKTIARTSDFVK